MPCLSAMNNGHCSSNERALSTLLQCNLNVGNLLIQSHAFFPYLYLEIHVKYGAKQSKKINK